MIFNRLRTLKIRIPMKNFLYLLGIVLSVLSCADSSKVNPEIEKLAIDFKVKRFDKVLAQSTPSDIDNLKKEYPYFFSERYDNLYWTARMQDTLQKEIEDEVSKVFADEGETSAQLELLFKHIKYYFPKTKVPEVVMVATDVDYRNKVIWVDNNLLLVSLSNYLGSDHHFYEGIPTFNSKNFRKEQIAVDAAHAFAKAQTPSPRSSQFMELLISEGKKLYLMKQLLSQTPLNEVLSYNDEEFAFILENEIDIWEYFVRKELLFSTDHKLASRFINPAPFSKFYLEIDNETPGRIGRYIGYKIVDSYMANNNFSIKTMLLQDATSIFNNAKYKP